MSTEQLFETAVCTFFSLSIMTSAESTLAEKAVACVGTVIMLQSLKLIWNFFSDKE